MKQKGRAGGGRKKKPQPASREGSPEGVEGSPADAAAPEGQGNPSPSPSPASPAVKGGRTGNPFEEEEREAVMNHLGQTTCLLPSGEAYYWKICCFLVKNTCTGNTSLQPQPGSAGLCIVSL